MKNENEIKIKILYSDGVAVNEKTSLKVREDFAVLGHFCVKIIALRLFKS